MRRVWEIRVNKTAESASDRLFDLYRQIGRSSQRMDSRRIGIRYVRKRPSIYISTAKEAMKRDLQHNAL